MTARHEQIRQRAGDQQAMAVLVQPAIAHLGKAEYSFDDPIACSTRARVFDLVRFFRPLDLINQDGMS